MRLLASLPFATLALVLPFHGAHAASLTCSQVSSSTNIEILEPLEILYTQEQSKYWSVRSLTRCG